MRVCIIKMGGVGVGFDVSMAVETCFCAKRYLDYILDLYTNAISIQAKSDCADDQGELIKALARNHSVRDKVPHPLRFLLTREH